MSTPIENEARSIDTADVTWRDQTFTVPAVPDDWDVELTLAFEEGKAATAIRYLLGASQWAAFMAMTPKPTNRDLSDLFDTIAQTLGFTNAGE